MNKKKSLDFLQSCIDRVQAASDEEIKRYREAYISNCIEQNFSSAFEFISPMDDDGYLYETNDIRQMKFSNSDCNMHDMKWSCYRMKKYRSNESGSELVYAA